MQPHIRTDFARKVFDLFAFGVIFKLAGQDQVNLPLRAFVGGLQPAKHRQRMGLGGCRKSAQKQRCDGVVINLMVASEVAAGVGVRGKGCGVDAQRYDRELQLSWRLAAVSETGPKIFLPVIEDALECIAHGLGGADHGVPTLQRGCCKCSDRFHHRVTGGRVGDAAQAPPALIVSPANHA
jgi:hypothetical protein